MQNAITRRSSLISFVLVCLVIMAGCVTIRTDVVGNGDLKKFKRAYVEALVEDEFQIYGALFSELSDMGMEVVATSFKEPREADLLVKYTYDAGWDFSRYLKSFQFQFIDAVTGRVVAAQSYRSGGIWLGTRDRRLKAAFNELRAKNGYPPTKQFNGQ